MGFLLFSQRPRLMCRVGGWEWATALVARVVLTSPPTPSPWARAAPANPWRRLQEPLVGHFAAVLFSIVFSIPFLIVFGSILPPNMAPKINQHLLKTDAKLHPILGSVFNRLLVDFCSQLGPPEPNLALAG